MNINTSETENQELQYTIINHRARQELDLTMLEYCVIDSIYNLSNNPKYHGWCVIGKEHLADFLNCSVSMIKNAIRAGIKKGLIKKPVTKLNYHDTRKATTQLWYDTVIMKESNGVKNNLDGVKINPLKADNGAKITPYNDNDNKDSYKDNVIKIESLFKEFKIPEKDKLIWKAVYKNETDYLLRQLLYAKKKNKTSVKWIQAALNKDYDFSDKDVAAARDREWQDKKEMENATAGEIFDNLKGMDSI